MKILKTKEEKNAEAKEQADISVKEVTAKLKKYGKINLEFPRSDFKDVMSQPIGFGFQDLKKENRLLIVELVKSYDLKFEPILYPCGEFGLAVRVKKMKD